MPRAVARIFSVATLVALVALAATPTSAAPRFPARSSSATDVRLPDAVDDLDETHARVVAHYPNGSLVLEHRLWATTVSHERRYRIFVPPGYMVESRRYPAVYMLHGVAGDSTEWQELGLLAAADRLIGEKQIDPFLIVLPDGGPNYWVKHASGARWGDYVVEDVVRSVDRFYRTDPARRARAVGGLSMGGEGALRLALLNPDVFSIAAAHAPSLRTSFDQLSLDLQDLYGDPDHWRSVSPYWLVRDGDAAERLTIWLDVGEDDPWRENVEALHDRLTYDGIAHRFTVLAGEHDPSYWEMHLDRFLRFYAEAFSLALAAE